MRSLRAAIAVLSLAAAPALAAESPDPGRRSGYEFMSRETRAMQDDDGANPGLLWVAEGERLWRTAAGTAGSAVLFDSFSGPEQAEKDAAAPAASSSVTIERGSVFIGPMVASRRARVPSRGGD